LKESIIELQRIAQRHPSIQSSLDIVKVSFETFSGQLDYTRMFIDSLQTGEEIAFKAAPQVKRIIDKFGSFAEGRGISVRSEIGRDIEVPAMHVTVYSGILLNLYTNALKAIVAAKSQGEKPAVVFRGWNEPKAHVIEVLDTGIGIPPNMRSRIWDPLFTTTSRLNNPLGSGMGLGLSLVKQLVIQIGGKIEIVDAPAGFSTCFRVEFRRK
jgi:signal transduction histidine kinase